MNHAVLGEIFSSLIKLFQAKYLARETPVLGEIFCRNHLFRQSENYYPTLGPTLIWISSAGSCNKTKNLGNNKFVLVTLIFTFLSTFSEYDKCLSS